MLQSGFLFLQISFYFYFTVISDPEQANIIIKATNCKGFAGYQIRRLVGNGLVFAPSKLKNMKHVVYASIYVVKIHFFWT